MSNNTDFEKSLAELEKIVSELESGECPLDESMKLFERGIELSEECRKTLENARQKITVLTHKDSAEDDK